MVIADNRKYFNEEIKILSTLHFNNTADMNHSSDSILKSFLELFIRPTITARDSFTTNILEGSQDVPYR